jgi:hypothetical protein
MLRNTPRTSSSTTRFSSPIRSRKTPETDAPTTPPYDWSVGSFAPTVLVANASAAVSPSTIEECPSEKKKPTPIERRPPCRSLRAVLSIAAM